MINVMERIPYEEKLKRLGLFCLEETREMGHNKGYKTLNDEEKINNDFLFTISCYFYLSCMIKE